MANSCTGVAISVAAVSSFEFVLFAMVLSLTLDGRYSHLAPVVFLFSVIFFQVCDGHVIFGLVLEVGHSKCLKYILLIRCARDVF